MLTKYSSHSSKIALLSSAVVNIKLVLAVTFRGKITAATTGRKTIPRELAGRTYIDDDTQATDLDSHQ